jgi:NADP-dependent 3-hydroxy acid dehydrogenase YdfG
MTETEFSEVRFHGDKERGALVYQNIEPLTAENIAESIRFAVTQPAHVNINRIEIMPTMQAPSGLAVKRKPS